MFLHRLLKRIHPACVRPLENAQWRRRGYASPSPTHVKHAVPLRVGMPEQTWLARLSGDAHFWLDGHYSAGVTLRAPQETPIIDELAAIAAALPQLGRVAVMIDDLRCFAPQASEGDGYPRRSFLVDWANTYGLSWHIEHDIFVARSH